jgi:hypothetical protein
MGAGRIVRDGAKGFKLRDLCGLLCNRLEVDREDAQTASQPSVPALPCPEPGKKSTDASATVRESRLAGQNELSVRMEKHFSSRHSHKTYEKS